MPTKKEIVDAAKKIETVLVRRPVSKKIRIPSRVEDISLKWLRNAPFFSEFLLRFNYFVTDQVPTMGVNSTKGRINLYINDEFLNGGGKRPKIKDGELVVLRDKNGDELLDKDGNVQVVMEDWKGLTEDELEGVLIHEIMHLIRMHHERLHSKDHYIWNIAGDMLINDDISTMSIGSRQIKLPEGAVYLKMAQDEGYNDEVITEPVYDWLLDEAKKYMNAMQDLMESQEGESQGQCQSCGGSGESEEDCKSCGGSGKDENGEDCKDCGGSGKEKCEECGGSGQSNGNGTQSRTAFDAKYNSNIDDHSKLQESDQLAESTIKEVINTGKIRGWGSISGNSVSKLDELCKPAKVNWKKMLRKNLSKHIFAHGNLQENSWSKRNRRSLPLPGTKKFSNRIVIGVDTSGSISQKELEQFFTEIEVIIKDTENLSIVQWDTKVQAVWPRYKRRDWKKIDVMGRGGTDVQDMFDWMVKEHRQKEILVMFTDGQFSMDYDMHGITTIWCVTSPHDNPVGGSIVHIDVNP